MNVSSELVASVQSLVTVLQQQIDTDGHQGAANTQEVTLAHHRLTHTVIKSFISSCFLFVLTTDDLFESYYNVKMCLCAILYS